MNRITTGAVAVLLIVVAALAWTADHYHGNAVKYKDQRDTATHNLNLANATITDMTKRQRDVAALDAKYTKELADAKAENDALRDDVAAGRRRLLVNATCPAMPTGKSATPGSVGNAATVELSNVAGRNVLDIRAGITSDQAKLRYLQEYVRTQCLKENNSDSVKK
ncbi:lysis protein [Salmonella enterica]